MPSLWLFCLDPAAPQVHCSKRKNSPFSFPKPPLFSDLLPSEWTFSCLPCTLSADFTNAMVEKPGMPGAGSPPPLRPLTLMVLARLCTVLQVPCETEGDLGGHAVTPCRSSMGAGCEGACLPWTSPQGSLSCGTTVPHRHPLDRAHPSVTCWHRNTIDLTECCPRMNVSQLPPVFVFDKCLSFGSHPPSSWGLLCCDNLLFHCHSVRCLKRIIGRYFCSLDVKK